MASVFPSSRSTRQERGLIPALAAMTALTVIVVLLALSELLCMSSVVIGRKKVTRPHQVAFYSGLAGLLASLIWLASLCGLALQIPYLRLGTAVGTLFLLSTVALFCACLMSLLAFLSIHAERHAANKRFKPTGHKQPWPAA